MGAPAFVVFRPMMTCARDCTWHTFPRHACGLETMGRLASVLISSHGDLLLRAHVISVIENQITRDFNALLRDELESWRLEFYRRVADKQGGGSQLRIGIVCANAFKDQDKLMKVLGCNFTRTGSLPSRIRYQT